MSKQAITKDEQKKDAVAVYDYGEDKGRGYEQTTKADFMIPFLSVLQSNSPEIEQGNPKELKDARAGMLIDSVTKDLFPGREGRIIVPLTTQHVFVEWVKRTKGGGFVAVHEVESEVVKKARAAFAGKFGKIPVGEDNELVETYYMYAMILPNIDGQDAEGEVVVIAFTSTKIKAYRKIMSVLRKEKDRPPLFANRVKICSVADKNAKGSFFNFDLSPALGTVRASLIPPVVDGKPHPVLVAAKGFLQILSEGGAKVAYDTQATEGTDDPSDDGVFK